MKYNFKSKMKATGMTLAEVGTMGAGMIAARKFLDFETLFPNADKEAWYIKYQGGVKLVIGAVAAAHIPNPWLKLLFIGVAGEGFIRTARQVTMNKEGVSFFEQIGKKRTGAAATDDDQKMLDAARAINNANGNAANVPALNPTQQYPSWVSGMAGNMPSVDLQDNAQNFVAGMGMSGVDTFGDF